MMKKVFLFAIIFGMLNAVHAASLAATPVEIRVAAAADLKFVLGDVIKEYNMEHPEQTVSAIFGSSGSFTTQIQQGAPFDLFLSADTQNPETLAKEGKAEGAVFPYSVGHIVLWVPNESKLDLSKGLNVLTDSSIKKIAIANSAHAPYGRAAEQALKKSGIYEKISAKIVMGENIAQTAQFIETKAADIGIIAISLAVSPTLKAEGRFVEVDANLYEKMIQSGIVVKTTKNLKQAIQFKDFVLSAKAQKILNDYGLKTIKK